MTTADDQRAALWAYTLEHRGTEFLHQHTVDALAAQQANVGTTPLQLTFALVGLYLYVEQGYTGRQVQRVHAALARQQPTWPDFALPAFRGALTVDDVLAAPAGPARDAAIQTWCGAVWAAYGSCRDDVVTFLHHCGVR
jgi:hypothetical protein